MKFSISGMLFICLFLSALLLAVPCFCNDLDDGISTNTDDSIEKYDEIGKIDTNINYIVVESMSSAKSKKDEKDKNTNFNDGTDENSENSIVLGEGTRVDGPVININIQK